MHLLQKQGAHALFLPFKRLGQRGQELPVGEQSPQQVPLVFLLQVIDAVLELGVGPRQFVPQ